MDGFKTQIQHGIDFVDEAVTQLETEKSRMDDKWSIFTEQSQMAKAEVEKKCEELKKLVDDKKATLLKLIDNVNLQQENEVGRRKAELDEHKKVMEDFKVYAREVKEKGTYFDITTSQEKLRDRSIELKDQHTKTLSNKFIWKNIAFREKVWLSPDSQIVGSLDVTDGE